MFWVFFVFFFFCCCWGKKKQRRAFKKQKTSLPLTYSLPRPAEPLDLGVPFLERDLALPAPLGERGRSSTSRRGGGHRRRRRRRSRRGRRAVLFFCFRFCFFVLVSFLMLLPFPLSKDNSKQPNVLCSSLKLRRRSRRRARD